MRNIDRGAPGGLKFKAMSLISVCIALMMVTACSSFKSVSQKI